MDICIATFKRPELLSRLLNSISEQQYLPVRDQLQIIVVDNDAHGTARQVVDAFARRNICGVVYDIEPVQNIALTRNRALNYVNGEYVLFVDDDEYVSDFWLRNHVQCALSFEADVVFGPVIPMLPDDAEPWILKGGFYRRARYVTGTQRDRGGTGNTLVRAEILKEKEAPFDPGMGLTGGEDSKLFYTLYKKGCRLIWCDEAEVYEHVAKDRMTIRWLSFRAFRGGQMFIRVFHSNMPFFKKLPWFLLRCVFLTLYSISIPFCWIWGRHLGVRALQKACSYLGQLTAIAGFSAYEEYRHG